MSLCNHPGCDTYLNFIEKFHCTYCACGSGLMACASEIVGRTQAYFCPIKHARKMLGARSRCARFLRYGDAQDYEAKLEGQSEQVCWV